MAKVTFKTDNCKGCGLCITACPKKIIALSKDEINRLIDSMPEENALWVSNENERRDLYRGILAKGDHLELIKLIKALYAHKKAREADGRRLHMSDERFFKEAEQLLYDEFQYVLKLHNKDDLMKYILARIEKKNS